MISLQTEFCPELPPVYAHKGFHELQAQLERIDALVVQSELESRFIASFPFEERKTECQRRRLIEALRCTVIRILFQLSYCRAANELACNLLYLKFCGLIRIDGIKVPSAKTLERYEKMVSPAVLRELSTHLNHAAATPSHGSDAQPLQLAEPVTLGVEYVDATALKARVHHPVDWMLLRDAVRTLTLGIEQVRKRGICSRMPKAPKAYRSAMNKLCIRMTHARRTADAKKTRKKILRQMKKLVRVVEGLARGHLAKLCRQGAKKGLRIETMLMLERKLTAILDQIDSIIRQAHERIIGERRVKNGDKILSLYESDMHVIVRGKANAEVEFGNKLFLAEQADGLIVDWHLYQEKAPADSRMLPDHLQRMQEEHGIELESITGDRGFDSVDNTQRLDGKVENNLCPRNVEQLEQRLCDKSFREHQTRRAQTEARIAIVMHGFLGNPARKWGFPNKERLCAWAVLTHNLWVLARLPQQAAQAQAA